MALHLQWSSGGSRREDQYMDEGLWHIRRRNEEWSAGQDSRAWSENLILERFFAPVLDTPSYALPAGARWPADQRADAARRVCPKTHTRRPS